MPAQSMNPSTAQTQRRSKGARLFTHRRSEAERQAAGKKLRDACPREAHAVWKARADRPEPVSLVRQADKGRLPQLVPLRHGRMALSPFTFYRADFSVAYADQNEEDYAALKRAIKSGKLEAVIEDPK